MSTEVFSIPIWITLMSTFSHQTFLITVFSNKSSFQILIITPSTAYIDTLKSRIIMYRPCPWTETLRQTLRVRSRTWKYGLIIWTFTFIISPNILQFSQSSSPRMKFKFYLTSLISLLSVAIPRISLSPRFCIIFSCKVIPTTQTLSEIKHVSLIFIVSPSTSCKTRRICNTPSSK